MREILPVMVGIFDDPDAVLHAAESARDKGWQQLDMITPYPVHGSEKALGLKKSWVPYVTLSAGLAGATGGFLFQVWAHSIDWKLDIGGKPLVAWPAIIPITFECGILAGGIATFVAMWIACHLPKANPRVFDERLTDDQFALIIPLAAGMQDPEIETFLKEAGAHEVRRVDA